jgi:hypothetical protein
MGASRSESNIAADHCKRTSYAERVGSGLHFANRLQEAMYDIDPPTAPRVEKCMRHDGGGACEGCYGQFAVQISHTVRLPSYGGSPAWRGSGAAVGQTPPYQTPTKRPDDTRRCGGPAAHPTFAFPLLIRCFTP